MNKKAIMGIGTLIIFIATILVAAVAAGVIISTSGVLQQKALIVSEQSRNRLVNGVQITHVFMAGNTSEKTANNIEVLARPEPASGPINFKTTYLSFFTDTGAYSASLSHESMITASYTPNSIITTFQSFGDIDDDGISDQIRLTADGGAGIDTIEINFSTVGLSDSASTGIDFDTAGQDIELEDIVITVNGSAFAYVHINDSSTSAGQLDANSVTITDELKGDCAFRKLKPETRYCIVTLTGVDDTALEYGETVFVYFKLTDQNKLSENDEFEIKLFPQDGRSTYILDRVPQVIYKTRLNVYP